MKYAQISSRLLLLAVSVLLPASAVHAQNANFMNDVAPVLVQRCTACHGSKNPKGDYRLYSFDSLVKPGGSDQAPVVAGKPEESELFLRITETEKSRRMPPGDEPLSAREIEAIRRWIAQGAKFDGKDRTAALQSILPPRKHPEPPLAYRAPVPIFALAFSPDGKELAVGGHYEITLWDPATGKLLRRVKHLPQRIQSLSYHRDGRQMLIAGGTPGEYGEVLLVDAFNPDRRRTFSTFEDIALSAAFSHDFSRLAVGAADRWVRAYRLADSQLLWQSQLQADWVTAISFSHDDRFVATASKDKTIKILEADTGNLFTTYNGHRKQFGDYAGQFAVFDVAFAPKGLSAFSAGEGPVIRAWNPIKVKEESGSARDMEARFAKLGSTKYLVHGAARPVFKLAVQGDSVFSACGDGMVRQHDGETGKLIREFSGHTDWVFAVAVHAPGQRIASGAFDGEVRVWDVATGDCKTIFKAAPGLR